MNGFRLFIVMFPNLAGCNNKNGETILINPFELLLRKLLLML